MKHFGKFKAKIVDINDPEKRGRVKVMCPKVLGDSKSAWCETCVPVTGDKDGDFFVPNVNESVWVEFEDGEVDSPILVGSWYGENQVPTENYGKERVISHKGSKVVLDGEKMTLKRGSSEVVITNTNISLKVGSTTLILSPSEVSVTQGSTFVFNQSSIDKLNSI